MKILWIVAISALLTMGCGNKDEGGESPKTEPTAGMTTDTPATDTGTTPTTGADQATAGTQPEGGDPATEVPTVEDYEAEAMAAIKAENLEEELKKLEDELGE